MIHLFANDTCISLSASLSTLDVNTLILPSRGKLVQSLLSRPDEAPNIGGAPSSQLSEDMGRAVSFENRR